jgi:pimeloyl-ACP methyl ester carboxylesterase
MIGKIASGLLVSASLVWAQDALPAKEVKPVSVQRIQVEPGVSLEVLDWGGRGRPLVLLAGLGSDTHEFDAFAPHLATYYHVYAFSRRGFGGSDTPPGPYLANRLGDDIIAALDSLKLARPVLVGHSIAGEELSSVGSRFPERVAGLVYLEAGYPFALYDRKLGDVDVDTAVVLRDMQTLTSSPIPEEQHLAVQQLIEELPGFVAELQTLEQRMKSAPKLNQEQIEALKQQAKSRESKSVTSVSLGATRFSGVRCPVLAIFAIPHEQGIPAGAVRDAADAADLKETGAQADAFQAANPQATVIRIAHANHLVFQSNEADVLRAMQTFIASLP